MWFLRRKWFECAGDAPSAENFLAYLSSDNLMQLLPQRGSVFCFGIRLGIVSNRIPIRTLPCGSLWQHVRASRGEERPVSWRRQPPYVDPGTVWCILCVMQRPKSTYLLVGSLRRIVVLTTSIQCHAEVRLDTSTRCGGPGRRF